MFKGATRGFLCFAAGLLAGAVVLPALRPRPPERVPTFVTDSPAEAALERPIDEFRFEGTRREAVEELARRAGVTIEAEWGALAEADYPPDARVRLNRRGTPLTDLLAELVGDHRNAYPVRVTPAGLRVRLLTGDVDAGDGLHVRIYDVRDLLTTDGPEPPAVAAGNGTGLFGLGSAVGPRGYYDDGSDLCELIRWTAAPGSWTDTASGGTGNLRYSAGRLIVTNAWAGHREVRRLLAELRRPGTPTRGTAGDRVGYAWNPSAGVWVSADPGGFEERLERSIGPLNLTDVTFAEAVAAFAKVSGIPASIDEDAINREGPLSVHRFSVACSHGPAAAALEEILAAWPPILRVDHYWSREGALVFTTPGAAADHAYLRLYDLTNWPPLVAEMRTIGQPGVIRRTASAVMDGLKSMVTHEVAHDSWRANGGQAGEIHSYYGALLVRQTPRGHRAVRRFLADVRSLEHLQSPAAATRPAR